MIPQCHTIPTPYIVGPVHCYSTELDGELTLFDCGPPTAECRRFLTKNIDLSRLKNLILTHGHIEHWGQALWLAEQGVTVYMPQADHLKIVRWEERRRGIAALMSEVGFPKSWLRQFDKAYREDAIYSEFPPGYRIVEEELPEHFGLKVHACPGHSVSDLVYEGDGWIVSGDTLLDGIFQSPVLDLEPGKNSRFLNYRACCRSIVELASLQGNTVLPGHRSGHGVKKMLLGYVNTALSRAKRFRPWQGENLMKVLDVMLEGRIRGPFHIYLKISELLFLTDFLTEPELLRNALKDAGLYNDVAPHFEEVFE